MATIEDILNQDRKMIFVHAGKIQLAIWAKIKAANNACLYSNKYNELDELYMLRNKITDIMYSLDNVEKE